MPVARTIEYRLEERLNLRVEIFRVSIRGGREDEDSSLKRFGIQSLNSNVGF